MVSFFWVNILSLELNSNCCISIKERLKRAKLWNRNADIIRADAQNLPFQNAVFDAIICKAVLHHVLTLRQTIDEMYRAVKKNDLVAAINEPNKLNPL